MLSCYIGAAKNLSKELYILQLFQQLSKPLSFVIINLTKEKNTNCQVISLVASPHSVFCSDLHWNILVIVLLSELILKDNCDIFNYIIHVIIKSDNEINVQYSIHGIHLLSDSAVNAICAGKILVIEDNPFHASLIMTSCYILMCIFVLMRVSLELQQITRTKDLLLNSSIFVLPLWIWRFGACFWCPWMLF